jgi:hypothetical protein
MFGHAAGSDAQGTLGIPLITPTTSVLPASDGLVRA